MLRLPAIVIITSIAFASSVLAQDQKNLISDKAGARIVSFSSNYEGSWDVSNLIGGGEDWYGDLPVWCTAENAPFPHWVVIELPKRAWFTTLIFNNFIPDEAGGWEGISAKDIEVHLSDGSATDGFRKVASFRLERNKNNQEVRVEPTQGKWLKIVVTANWGHAEYTELGKLGALDDGSRPMDIALELKNKGSVDIYGVYFDFASANLRPESSTILEKIAGYMKDNPGTKLAIEGHTDNIGDAKKNQVLSENRAKSVVDAVTKLGVDSKRLTAVGFGATKPVADNKTITGRAKNRRVTLRVGK
jgi:outer membrane protein OmpA-like peptidoglycan-associated protein